MWSPRCGLARRRVGEARVCVFGGGHCAPGGRVFKRCVVILGEIGFFARAGGWCGGGWGGRWVWEGRFRGVMAGARASRDGGSADPERGISLQLSLLKRGRVGTWRRIRWRRIARRGCAWHTDRVITRDIRRWVCMSPGGGCANHSPKNRTRRRPSWTPPVPSPLPDRIANEPRPSFLNDRRRRPYRSWTWIRTHGWARSLGNRSGSWNLRDRRPGRLCGVVRRMNHNHGILRLEAAGLATPRC